MANDHYTRAYDPQPTQRVGSTDLKNEFQAVEAGFDSVQVDTSRTLRQVGGAEMAPMPNAISRAMKLLSFDAGGNPVMVAGGGRFRGDWLTATEYIVSDYFRDPITKNIYSTLIGHTSGVLATDIASGKVQLAINVADAEAAKVAAQAAAAEATTQAGIATTQAGIATTQAGIATAGASTATTQAGTATTQAGIATTQAGIATTQAGIATTQAGIATTKAAEAAASAASISSGPVTSVNAKTGVVTLVPADIGLNSASQVEMEAGTETTLRAMSPLRVAQAIAALGKGKITRSARTSNTALTAANIGQLIDITSGTFTQTFVACATLGSGWFVYLRNAGTGDITLDPAASETIDGVATKVLYPGQTVIVQCDGTALRTLPLGGVGVHSVVLTTQNGYGFTATHIPRYTTVQQNVGTAITYADSASSGTSFTINEPGIYSMTCTDLADSTSSGLYIGASLNSSQLSTNITSITAANRIAVTATTPPSSPGTFSRTLRLSAGDVVRPHFDGQARSASAWSAMFAITKVGL